MRLCDSKGGKASGYDSAETRRRTDSIAFHIQAIEFSLQVVRTGSAGDHFCAPSSKTC